jgi:hypothetical protein
MTEALSSIGYEQTKAKLAKLEDRLASLVRRTDLGTVHRAEAQRSCERMIAQYRREIKLYEASHPAAATK